MNNVLKNNRSITGIVIVSGGLDSVTLLHYVCKQEQQPVLALTFDYGQKQRKEIAFAKHHAHLLHCPHEIIDLAPLAAAFQHSALVTSDVMIPDVTTTMGDPQPPTYVPNRNMIFLSVAAAYAESLEVQDVYYGAQRHDAFGYWDTTPQFLDRLNLVFSLNRKAPIQIKAPFLKNSKADTLTLGLTLGVDYGQTWSCYEGDDRACGRCMPCAERLQAFEQVGRTDPLPYMERE